MEYTHLKKDKSIYMYRLLGHLDLFLAPLLFGVGEHEDLDQLQGVLGRKIAYTDL